MNANSPYVIKAAKDIINNFNKYAFENYFQEALKENIYQDYPLFKDYPKTELPNHTQFYSNNLSHGAWEHIFLIQFYHNELYKHKTNINLITKELKGSIDYLKKRFPYPIGSTENSPYVSLGSLFIVSNLNSEKIRVNSSFEKLQELFDKSFRDAHFEGIYNVNSFFHSGQVEPTNNYISSLKTFINNSFDGISLEINKDFIRVNPFNNQAPICSGININHPNPLETVISTNSINQYYIFKEFEDVINNGTENQLEEFIAAHFDLILGKQYDKIETELWLRFPDLDIIGKNRRLDIFARNTLTGDWDLFELKKNTPITTTYRDIPSFRAEIYHAIQQLKNYSNIMRDDKVKRYFQKKGIEYYEPSLNLVIGKKPQINSKEWMRLLKNNSDGLNIITYDRLLENVKLNFKIYKDFLS